MPAKVPERFATKTLYNPKLVLVHMDEIKEVCLELQSEIQKLNLRIDALEAGLKSKETKESKVSTSTKP